VLIYGEAGTGKKVCARYIHDHSLRGKGPFVDVSIGSIIKENAAIELFGSEDDGVLHYGRLERANGGTLYLDDVADMDMDLQTKLQGALQSRSFARVGGVESVTMDARIIAVTQQDLEGLVKAKEFREDLFYQLSVVPIQVPPLRERREEILDLLNYYSNVFVQRDGLPYRKFTMAAQNRLRNYVWPGNIRELINIVQRLLILGADEEVSAEEVDMALGAQSYSPVSEGGGIDYRLPLKQAREQFEKAYFEFQLRETEGGVSQVAKNAGVERTHLYRKLRALGINPKDEKG
jgi:DNA-binding NtrC family response regulator